MPKMETARYFQVQLHSYEKEKYLFIFATSVLNLVYLSNSFIALSFYDLFFFP